MIKKYFYKIYEKILGKFDDNDGNCLDNIIKNDLVLMLVSIVTEWIFPILLKVQK